MSLNELNIEGALRGDAGLAVFALAPFLENFMGDEALACEIAECALPDMEQHLSRVEGHVSAGNWAEAHRSMHSFKGLAIQCGGEIVFSIAHQLDTLLRAGAAVTLQALKVLREHFDVFRGALINWLRQIKD